MAAAPLLRWVHRERRKGTKLYLAGEDTAEPGRCQEESGCSGLIV